MRPELTTRASFWTLLLAVLASPNMAAAQLDFSYTEAAPELNIVAHQDDDLLFISPMLAATIEAGLPVRTVYLTAGNAQWNCPAYAADREEGIKEAYAQMAGVPVSNWSAVPATYATKQVVQYTLAGTDVSLIFMRLKNDVGPFLPTDDNSVHDALGNLNTLAHGGDLGLLWHSGDSGVTSISTFSMSAGGVSLGTVTYQRQDIIDALAAMMDGFAIDAGVGSSGLIHVNLLDPSELATFDSPDHVHSAMFGLAALQKYQGRATTRLHETYMTTMREGNLHATEANYRTNVFLTYGTHDPRIANPNCDMTDGTVPYGCPSTYSDGRDLDCDPYDGFYSLMEDVVIAMGAVQASEGRLSAPGGLCIVADADSNGQPIRVRACNATGATRWKLADDRTVRSPGNHCLRANPVDGASLSLGSCSGEEAHFVLFDVGQLRGPGGYCVETSGGTGSVLRLGECDSDAIATQNGFGLQFGEPDKASSGSNFSLSQVSASMSQYPTVALTDVGGDGVADVCARRSGGVYCAMGSGTTFASGSYVFQADFDNWSGWGGDEYGSTVQFADIDGQHGADLCGRGVAGVRCAKALASGGFESSTSLVTNGYDFSDYAGYGTSESYYRTVAFADVTGDGQVELCARNAWGVECAEKDASGKFTVLRQWTTEFSDALGWSPGDHGATIMFGDVNGDGRDDVCGRGELGIRCALSDGDSFELESLWGLGDFSDAMGWTAGEDLWGSLRLVDVDGNGTADVCARGISGLRCHLSWGGGFGQNVVRVSAPGYANAAGWDAPEFGATLSFDHTSSDGAQRVCARGPQPGTGSFWSGPDIVLMCADR